MNDASSEGELIFLNFLYTCILNKNQAEGSDNFFFLNDWNGEFANSANVMCYEKVTKFYFPYQQEVISLSS